MPKIIKRVAAEPGVEKVSDLWQTDPRLFRALHEEFGFEIDLAANTENHLLGLWFGMGGVATDALAVRWLDYARVGYLNPPYSSALILAFMAKAVEEARSGFTSVCLTPYTPDTAWWQHTASASEIRSIPHRLRFGRPSGLPALQAMFPSAVIVFRPQPGIVRGEPRQVVWTFR